MPVLAHVLDTLVLEVGDPARPLSAFRARQIVAEAKKHLKDGAVAAHAYALMAALYIRTGHGQDALDCAQRAARLAPNTPAHLSNVGAALLTLERPAEALQVLLTIEEKDAGLIVMVNMAEALFKLGLVSDATAAFSEAVRIANHKDATQLFILATHAAQIGLNAEAVELFARFIMARQAIKSTNADALDIIERAPSEAKAVLVEPHCGPLKSTIDLALSFRSVPSDLRRTVAPSCVVTAADAVANDAATMDVFEATRSGRARATRDSLTEDHDV